MEIGLLVNGLPPEDGSLLGTEGCPCVSLLLSRCAYCKPLFSLAAHLKNQSPENGDR